MKNKLYSLVLVLFLASLIAFPAEAKPLLDVVTTNDNNKVITYSGTWTHLTGQTGNNFDDLHSSATTNDYAQLTFTGVSVSIIAPQGPDLGKADVYIDTVLDTTIDLYAATAALNIIVYSKSNLTAASHTIKLKVRGDKNSASSAVTIKLDAFQYDDGGQQHQPDQTSYSLSITPEALAVFTTPYNSDHGSSVSCVPSSGTTIVCTGGLHGYASNFLGGQLRYYLDSAISPNDSSSHTVYYTFAISSVSNGSVTCVPSGCGSGTMNNFHTYQFWVNIVPVSSPGYYDASFSLTLSFEPTDQCYKRYITLNTGGPYQIDPTIETPLGQTGSPADEQIFPVTPSALISVRIAGGYWKSGSDPTHRYDFEYSFDSGTTWTLLHSASCVATDPIQDYWYTAFLQVPDTGTDFMIRAHESETPTKNWANNSVDGTLGKPLYYISYVALTEAITDCSAQFTYDPVADWIATVQVDADVPYTQVDAIFTPGDWYVIQIASGSWKDGGTGPDLYDGQYSWGSVLDHSATAAVYKDIGVGSSYCYGTSGNYNTVYVQADDSPSLYLRVKDLAETFTGNTGNLGMNIYHASFTRRPDTCELQFGISNLVGHSELGAQEENGVTIGISSGATTQQVLGSFMLVPGAWYMLETTDGPWGWVGSTHTDKSYEAAIKWDGEWVNLADWGAAGCNVQIDDLGHRRIFFQTPTTGAASYTFRVDDSDLWFNNVGSLGIDLYQAIDQQTSLPDGSCDYIYDQYQPVGSAWIDSTISTGASPGALDKNTLYAVEIQGNDYYWTETSGGTHLYDLQISDDNGTTWHVLPNNYGGVLCYYQTGNTTILFIQTGDHYLYKFRVNSSSFSDNTGGMQIKLYKANAGDTVDPWTTGCLNGFTTDQQVVLYPLDLSGLHLHLDPTKSEGKAVISDAHWLADASILGFAVKVTNGPWHKNDGSNPDAHFDAALSKDNGATWHAIGRDNTDIVCADVDQLGLYWTAYFKVDSTDTWKIRVNDDSGSNWGDNSGNLWFEVYAIVSQAAPDCVIDTNRADCMPPGVAIEINGQDVCTMVLTPPEAPTSLDASDWLSYLSGIVTYDFNIYSQWMAWCPWHTDALMQLLELLKNKEPYATLVDFGQFIQEIKRQMDSYNWSDSSAPPSILGNQNGVVNQIMNKVFPPMGSNSPWAGGPLVSFNKHWSATSYYNSCVANFQDLLGPLLPSAVCFASDEMRETGASFWIQLLLDIGIFFWALRNIWGDATRLAHFMVGINYIGPSNPTINIDMSGRSDAPVSTGWSRRRSRRL